MSPLPFRIKCSWLGCKREPFISRINSYCQWKTICRDHHEPIRYTSLDDTRSHKIIALSGEQKRVYSVSVKDHSSVRGGDSFSSK